MAVYQTRALVLKRNPYRESDWIVTLLAENGRRLTGFAHNARKSQKRFGGALDTFNLVEAVLTEKEGRQAVTIESASVLFGMEHLRRDLTKFAVACFLAEFILEFQPENEKAPLLFSAIIDILTVMNKAEALPEHWVPLLEHHFLDLFGYRPVFKNCLECGVELKSGGSYYFNGMKGGVVCQPCHALPRQRKMPDNSMASYPLSYSVIRQVLDGRQEWLKPGQETAWKPQEVNQARKALEFFIQYTAGKPLKSLQFLTQILKH